MPWLLPGVMALFELSWWDRKRGRALALGCLAVLPALMAMAYQRAAVLSTFPPVQIPFLDNPLAAAGFWSAKLTAVRLLAKYLGLLIWPAHLSWDYSYAQIPMVTGSLADWAGWMAVAVVGAAAFPGLAPQPHRLLRHRFRVCDVFCRLQPGAIRRGHLRGALPLSAGHRVGYMPGSGGGRTGAHGAGGVCA